jgi:hypothetical protein
MFEVENWAFCQEIDSGWMLNIDLIDDVLQQSQCLRSCGGNGCTDTRYVPLSQKSSASFVVEGSLPELQRLHLDEPIFQKITVPVELSAKK